jgi:hypothetical protein
MMLRSVCFCAWLHIDNVENGVGRKGWLYGSDMIPSVSPTRRDHITRSIFWPYKMATASSGALC